MSTPRFKVKRSTTTSGRTKVWAVYGEQRVFPGVQCRRGTAQENEALAVRLAAVLNAGSWVDEEHEREGAP